VYAESLDRKQQDAESAKRRSGRSV